LIKGIGERGAGNGEHTQCLSETDDISIVPIPTDILIVL